VVDEDDDDLAFFSKLAAEDWSDGRGGIERFPLFFIL
jgi:hypothetical protein